MITQYEAGALLKATLPQSGSKNYPSRPSLEIYALMIHFSDYTKQVLKEHNFDQARKCFALAERLYTDGDRLLRLLVEDSFIHSVSSIMTLSSSDMFMVKAILPDTLYKLYKKQFLKNINNN